MNWWMPVPRTPSLALMLSPVLLALCWSPAASAQMAQETATPTGNPPISDTPSDPNEQIEFSAERLEYDQDSDVVIASGQVNMVREGNQLRADSVSWDRASGKVVATGNVRITNPEGDVAYGDSIELQDTLKDGIAQNMLLVLADGGRLAALHGERSDGVTQLDRASYSPCAVEDHKGCPKQPLWRIDAVRVIHDPVKHRIRYQHARLSFLGVPVLSLPGLSHPDGSGAGGSGLLIPDIRYRNLNGLELAVPMYLQLGPDRDLTLTTHVFSKIAPMLEAEYRQLTSSGAYKVGGHLTYGRRTFQSGTDTARDIRGEFNASGKFQLSPEWSITGATRLTTDKTFLPRYAISWDDRLRTMVRAEHITRRSYLSIAGWAVQDLRADAVQGRQPIALPAIDYRLRIADPVLGGAIEVQANSLALLRTEGQDTQRAFTSFKWEKRTLTAMGQELSLTAYGRADIYNTHDSLSTLTASYRGEEGWSSRAIGAVAADMRWPLLGKAFSGTQLITPRVQIVASPKIANLKVPNEDSRAIELEDSNLFALNRFPGYDRWEDSARVTYGADYALTLPGFTLRSVVGQSYRLNSRPSLFPNGTGLNSRLSDIVGRTTLAYGSRVQLIHRFRLDKDNLAIRRNEIDATVGSRRTYASVSYLRLNRDIDTSLEDLRDREELRVGVRLALNRYWSVFGTTVLNLTGKAEDPTTTSDGYDMLRQRVGVAYEDECFQFGLTWRRDRAGLGDARTGNSVLFRLAFKNLGR